ncbi:MAG TPA: hypothetical protein VGI67_08345 [Thermoleophilaceae bacterium]
MPEQAALETLRAALAADGYTIDAREDGERVLVEIGATPEACADCLAPRPVMQAILGKMFAVPAEQVELRYPEGAEP